MSYEARLLKKYKEDIIDALMKKFEYKSVMQVPKIVKVALNQGIGEATTDKKLLDKTLEELTLISGQRAVKTLAKKDVSNFKIRKGMPIGARVTLRRNRMYEFLDRLINVSIPRVKDFQGVNDKGFDGRGNFTFGISEQIIFPEISIDKVDKLTGMNITVVTTAQTDEEALELLKEFGFPFKNQNNNG